MSLETVAKAYTASVDLEEKARHQSAELAEGLGMTSRPGVLEERQRPSDDAHSPAIQSGAGAAP